MVGEPRIPEAELARWHWPGQVGRGEGDKEGDWERTEMPLWN